MKTGIKTLSDGIAFDNKSFIIENEQTVAEYIIESATNEDYGWNFFFSYEEIEEAGGDRPTDEMIEEVKDWLNANYNYSPEND